jgi:hypothetical protein
MKKDIITIAVLSIFIISIALWFSSTPIYIPYSASIFSNHARFESFSSRNVLEYTNVDNNSALDGPVTNYLINPSTTTAKAVSGFEGAGVFRSPDVAVTEKLDIFSQAKGSLKTDGYGYYNSLGPLELDTNMKNMLQTRGGNAAGKSTTVGGSPI